MSEIIPSQAIPPADSEAEMGLEVDSHHQQTLTAAAVCQQTGLSYTTISTWIRRGIIDVEVRFEAGKRLRVYTQDTLDQIAVVASLRQLEYSLSEIQFLKDNHLLEASLSGSEAPEPRLRAGSLGRAVYNWIEADLISSVDRSSSDVTPHVSQATVAEVAKIQNLRQNRFSPNEIKRMVDDGLSYEAIEAIAQRVIKPADLTEQFGVNESTIRLWTGLGLFKKADISKYGRIWYGLEALEMCASIIELKQQGYQMYQILDLFVDSDERAKGPDPSQKLLLAGEVASLVPGLSNSRLCECVMVGLIKPSQIGDQQGWRYYTEADVSLLRSLNHISDGGLRISEIKAMLDDGLDFEQMEAFIETHLKVDQVAAEIGVSPAAVAKWSRMGLLQTVRPAANIIYLWYPKAGLDQARAVKHLLDVGFHSEEIKAAIAEDRLESLVEEARDIVSPTQMAEFFGVSSRRIAAIARAHNIPRSKYSRYRKPLFDSDGLNRIEEILARRL